MILKISISNFFSIREEAIIDLQASSMRLSADSPLASNTFEIGGYKLLKSVAIFGPNASGKSNLLKAIDYCLKFICNSSFEDEFWNKYYIPFKFQNSITEHDVPGKFELEFLIENERYIYGFTLMPHKIVTEYLYSFPKRYKSLVFKRSLTSEGEYEFSYSKRFSRPKEVEANISLSSLFLTLAARMNRPIPRRIVDYFKDNIVMGLPALDIAESENILRNHKDIVLQTLAKADSDIVDYDFRPLPEAPQRLKLVTFHRTDPSKPFNFVTEESAGTIRMLSILLTIIDATQREKTLLVDELETSLHPQLTQYVVKMFNQTSRSQLIFATHDLDLMDTGILRPDQIYFTMKDFSTGSSDVYSLADFTDYKNYRHLRRDYIQGRFDAIPILG